MKTSLLSNLWKLVALCALISIPLAQVSAMDLKDEELKDVKIYVPTVSAVKKTLTKMGIDFVVDEDGDLKYEMDNTGWTIYVIFDRFNDRLWNLQMLAQFDTKLSKYDKLVSFANDWNTEHKAPKISFPDKETLKATWEFPIEYGYNPDEFEENGIIFFQRALKDVADETYDWRK